MDKAREVLLNAYLDLSTESTNLRDMAYAKAILWVLFAEEQVLSIEEVIKKVSFLVGVGSVPKPAAQSAMALLVLKKSVLLKNGNYELSPVERQDIDRKIKYSADATKKILRERFPNEIDPKVLKSWFEESSSQYFGAETEKIIALYTKKSRPIFNVDGTLIPIIEKYGLKKYETELLQGYKEFLLSAIREEEEKVFQLVSSILSSRLVAANLSPDFLSIEKYRDCTMLIDTNILFEMRIYSDEEVSRALDALGATARTLNIKFAVAEFTVQEYENVRNRARNEFLLLASCYSQEIFKDMNENNDFVRAMLRLGCKTVYDVEVFFNSTLEIPKILGGQAINVLSGKKLRGCHYIEELDKGMLDEIRAETGKSENQAMHDLRLMKLAKSSSEKTFVLTRDTTMEAFALNRVNDKEEPKWISLYSLIQILAINGGGPDFNSSDLAPLIKLFLGFEETTNAEQYDDRDLLLLLEKTDRVNELPHTQMVSLLNKLHRVKLQRSPAEAVREITMDLERALRQNTFSLDEKIRDKQEIIDSLTTKNQVVGSNLVKEKTKNIWIWFIFRNIIYIALGCIIFWYIRNELIQNIENGLRFVPLEEIILVLSIVTFGFTDYFTFTKARIKEVNSNF